MSAGDCAWASAGKQQTASERQTKSDGFIASDYSMPKALEQIFHAKQIISNFTRDHESRTRLTRRTEMPCRY
jgi:hypothetical protein